MVVGGVGVAQRQAPAGGGTRCRAKPVVHRHHEPDTVRLHDVQRRLHALDVHAVVGVDQLRERVQLGVVQRRGREAAARLGVHVLQQREGLAVADPHPQQRLVNVVRHERPPVHVQHDLQVAVAVAHGRRGHGDEGVGATRRQLVVAQPRAQRGDDVREEGQRELVPVARHGDDVDAEVEVVPEPHHAHGRRADGQDAQELGDLEVVRARVLTSRVTHDNNRTQHASVTGKCPSCVNGATPPCSYTLHHHRPATPYN